MARKIKKSYNKPSLYERIECIKSLELTISANFEDLHDLYYNGLSNAETRRLRSIIESDGQKHYVVPKYLGK